MGSGFASPDVRAAPGVACSAAARSKGVRETATRARATAVLGPVTVPRLQMSDKVVLKVCRINLKLRASYT